MNPPTDLELLRRLEPILRFTDGELFFPMSTAPYVEECELLAGPTLREARVVVPTGELDPRQARERRRAGAGRGPVPPVRPEAAQRDRAPALAIPARSTSGSPPRAASRASACAARLVDAGMVASLLARGRVPGGTAAAASIKYEEIRARDPRIVYHGRVVREGRWVILHYMFFYAMNDWRSTFDGANDHEADLEQCFVVLEQFEDGTMQPAWFCAAAHDEKGDDLRRRWDDPRLETIDDHPVVYPGAGSHATYLERGEYIMLLPFPGERNIRGPLDLIRRVWRDTLSQPDPGDLAARSKRALSVPFVDYARGDGLTVGPGGDVDWDPVIISDADGWVAKYQGLWGLDTGDRFAGERAPAGPKYTRTGAVRQSWHDPLGFSGLDKVTPPSQAVPVLQGRIEELAATRAEVTAEAEHLAVELPKIDAEVAAIRTAAGVEHYRDERTVRTPRRARLGCSTCARRRSSSTPSSLPVATGSGSWKRAASTTRGPISITPPSPSRRRSRSGVRSARPGPRSASACSSRRSRSSSGSRSCPRRWRSSCSSAPTWRSNRSSTATSSSWSSRSPSSWRSCRHSSWP